MTGLRTLSATPPCAGEGPTSAVQQPLQVGAAQLVAPPRLGSMINGQGHESHGKQEQLLTEDGSEAVEQELEGLQALVDCVEVAGGGGRGGHELAPPLAALNNGEEADNIGTQKLQHGHVNEVEDTTLLLQLEGASPPSVNADFGAFLNGAEIDETEVGPRSCGDPSAEHHQLHSKVVPPVLSASVQNIEAIQTTTPKQRTTSAVGLDVTAVIGPPAPGGDFSSAAGGLGPQLSSGEIKELQLAVLLDEDFPQPTTSGQPPKQDDIERDLSPVGSVRHVSKESQDHQQSADLASSGSPPSSPSSLIALVGGGKAKTPTSAPTTRGINIMQEQVGGATGTSSNTAVDGSIELLESEELDDPYFANVLGPNTKREAWNGERQQLLETGLSAMKWNQVPSSGVSFRAPNGAQDEHVEEELEELPQGGTSSAGALLNGTTSGGTTSSHAHDSDSLPKSTSAEGGPVTKSSEPKSEHEQLTSLSALFVARTADYESAAAVDSNERKDKDKDIKDCDPAPASPSSSPGPQVAVEDLDLDLVLAEDHLERDRPPHADSPAHGPRPPRTPEEEPEPTTADVVDEQEDFLADEVRAQRSRSGPSGPSGDEDQETPGEDDSSSSASLTDSSAGDHSSEGDDADEVINGGVAQPPDREPSALYNLYMRDPVYNPDNARALAATKQVTNGAALRVRSEDGYDPLTGQDFLFPLGKNYRTTESERKRLRKVEEEQGVTLAALQALEMSRPAHQMHTGSSMTMKTMEELLNYGVQYWHWFTEKHQAASPNYSPQRDHVGATSGKGGNNSLPGGGNANNRGEEGGPPQTPGPGHVGGAAAASSMASRHPGPGGHPGGYKGARSEREAAAAHHQQALMSLGGGPQHQLAHQLAMTSKGLNSIKGQGPLPGQNNSHLLAAYAAQQNQQHQHLLAAEQKGGNPNYHALLAAKGGKKGAADVRALQALQQQKGARAAAAAGAGPGYSPYNQGSVQPGAGAQLNPVDIAAARAAAARPPHFHLQDQAFGAAPASQRGAQLARAQQQQEHQNQIMALAAAQGGMTAGGIPGGAPIPIREIGGGPGREGVVSAMGSKERVGHIGHGLAGVGQPQHAALQSIVQPIGLGAGNPAQAAAAALHQHQQAQSMGGKPALSRAALQEAAQQQRNEMNSNLNTGRSHYSTPGHTPRNNGLHGGHQRPGGDMRLENQNLLTPRGLNNHRPYHAAYQGGMGAHGTNNALIANAVGGGGGISPRGLGNPETTTVLRANEEYTPQKAAISKTLNAGIGGGGAALANMAAARPSAPHTPPAEDRAPVNHSGGEGGEGGEADVPKPTDHLQRDLEIVKENTTNTSKLEAGAPAAVVGGQMLNQNAVPLVVPPPPPTTDPEDSEEGVGGAVPASPELQQQLASRGPISSPVRAAVPGPPQQMTAMEAPHSPQPQLHTDLHAPVLNEVLEHTTSVDLRTVSSSEVEAGIMREMGAGSSSQQQQASHHGVMSTGINPNRQVQATASGVPVAGTAHPNAKDMLVQAERMLQRERAVAAAAAASSPQHQPSSTSRQVPQVLQRTSTSTSEQSKQESPTRQRDKLLAQFHDRMALAEQERINNSVNEQQVAAAALNDIESMSQEEMKRELRRLREAVGPDGPWPPSDQMGRGGRDSFLSQGTERPSDRGGRGSKVLGGGPPPHPVFGSQQVYDNDPYFLPQNFAPFDDGFEDGFGGVSSNPPPRPPRRVVDYTKEERRRVREQQKMKKEYREHSGKEQYREHSGKQDQYRDQHSAKEQYRGGGDRGDQQYRGDRDQRDHNYPQADHHQRRSHQQHQPGGDYAMGHHPKRGDYHDGAVHHRRSDRAGDQYEDRVRTSGQHHQSNREDRGHHQHQRDHRRDREREHRGDRDRAGDPSQQAGPSDRRRSDRGGGGEREHASAREHRADRGGHRERHGGRQEEVRGGRGGRRGGDPDFDLDDYNEYTYGAHRGTAESRDHHGGGREHRRRERGGERGVVEAGRGEQGSRVDHYAGGGGERGGRHSAAAAFTDRHPAPGHELENNRPRGGQGQSMHNMRGGGGAEIREDRGSRGGGGEHYGGGPPMDTQRRSGGGNPSPGMMGERILRPANEVQ